MTRGLRLTPRSHVPAPVAASPHRQGTRAPAPLRATRRVPARRQQEPVRPWAARTAAELMPLAPMRALLPDRLTIPRPRAPSTAVAIGQAVMAMGRANRVTMIIATAGATVGTGAATASGCAGGEAAVQ